MILDKKKYDNLWKDFASAVFSKKSIPKQPDYLVYLRREIYFLDYLDLFRGKRTNELSPRKGGRVIVHIDEERMHVEDVNDPPWLRDPSKKILENEIKIKYVLIGEAPPLVQPTTWDSCATPGDINNTYFYNYKNVKNSHWLSQPMSAFDVEISSAKLCASEKKKIYLLELAKNGFLLIDLYPFSIEFTSAIRNKLVKKGIGISFYENYLLKKIDKLKEENLISGDAIFAFSGPARSHHDLADKMAKKLLIPPGNIFDFPNVLCPNGTMTKNPNFSCKCPVSLLGSRLIMNCKYSIKDHNKIPVYRCCTYDGSGNPNSIYIKNAFDL